MSRQSIMYDLVGDSLIILLILCSLTDSKALKAEGVKVGASLEEPEVGNLSQTLLIFLRKMKQTCLQGFCLSKQYFCAQLVSWSGKYHTYFYYF